MKKLNNKKGFTIVELVIVIAVIGILAAVLIPTFSNVIKSAKDSADHQNAKNAYTQYLTEVVDGRPNADRMDTFNFCIKSGDYYFLVTEGVLSKEGTAECSKTAGYTGMKIEDGTLVEDSNHTNNHATQDGQNGNAND